MTGLPAGEGSDVFDPGYWDEVEQAGRKSTGGLSELDLDGVMLGRGALEERWTGSLAISESA